MPTDRTYPFPVGTVVETPDAAWAGVVTDVFDTGAGPVLYFVTYDYRPVGTYRAGELRNARHQGEGF